MFSSYLSKPFRDAYKGLRLALMGTDASEDPQWRYCIQDTNNVLGKDISILKVTLLTDYSRLRLRGNFCKGGFQPPIERAGRSYD